MEPWVIEELENEERRRREEEATSSRRVELPQSPGAAGAAPVDENRVHVFDISPKTEIRIGCSIDI